MKKLSRIIACIMLVIALGFLVYAINHHELSWPWSNTITFTIYIIYLFICYGSFIYCTI